MGTQIFARFRLRTHVFMWTVAAMVYALVGLSACGADPVPSGVSDPMADSLHFNQIVMRCTHNSYHRRPDNVLFPDHDYEHLPLPQQFDAGVRAIELDVHPQTGSEAQPDGDFPVYHLVGIDAKSTCGTLQACLQDVVDWSSRNPRHQMIVVWIEIKSILEWTTLTDFAGLDDVIRDTLGKHRLYTPQDFRRGYANPRAALDAEGWPTIGETRGRVMVVLLNVDDTYYSAYRDYAPADTRAMFSRARPEDFHQPWAVMAKVDDPRDTEAIHNAIDAKMLIASNTGGASDDDDTRQARLQAGLTSGTNMLCDDFPTPREDGYWMDIPQFFPSGCNAVTAPASCVNVDTRKDDQAEP